MEYAAARAGVRDLHGRIDGAVRGAPHRWLRAERHQAHHALFDMFAASATRSSPPSAWARIRFPWRLHLLTHAFFKALLFLGCGSVIHAMSDEQDIRKMGGIGRRGADHRGAVMWIGSLALAGIFPFAGYYSKDAILEAAWRVNTPIGAHGFSACGLIAAFLTAFYSWRLLILTFHGKSRADHHVLEHVHESPLVMTLPLMLLAVGRGHGGVAVPRAGDRAGLARVLGQCDRGRARQSRAGGDGGTSPP